MPDRRIKTNFQLIYETNIPAASSFCLFTFAFHTNTVHFEMNLTYFCCGKPENLYNTPPAVSHKGKNTDLF